MSVWEWLVSLLPSPCGFGDWTQVVVRCDDKWLDHLTASLFSHCIWALFSLAAFFLSLLPSLFFFFLFKLRKIFFYSLRISCNIFWSYSPSAPPRSILTFLFLSFMPPHPSNPLTPVCVVCICVWVWGHPLESGHPTQSNGRSSSVRGRSSCTPSHSMLVLTDCAAAVRWWVQWSCQVYMSRRHCSGLVLQSWHPLLWWSSFPFLFFPL